MELKITGQFKKDLKKYKHDTERLEALEEVLTHLRESGKVPDKYKPHPLLGEYSGCIECHVKNDFLLIWIDRSRPIIKLVRVGTHAELFRKM